MVCIGKFAAQNDVTIQKAPNGIRNRFVHVVALDQNRVYCGYCPAFACTVVRSNNLGSIEKTEGT